jgi:hypothetical protein
MKFDYCKDLFSANNGYFPLHHFHYTLDEDDVRKVIHKYAYSPEWMRSLFENFEYSPKDSPYKIGASLRVLQDALCDENVDLGTNYKAKYEELVKLLEPHKLEDNMEPATTLKMILKYGK